MYRLHPSWVAVRELVASGRIGRLTAVQSWFSYFNDDPTNIRNIAAAGGGALYDIGCYNVNLSRMLFGGEPVRVVVGDHARSGERRRHRDERRPRVRDRRRDVHLLHADRDGPARPHLRDGWPDLHRDPVQHPARSADADLRDRRRRPAGRARDRDPDVPDGRSRTPSRRRRSRRPSWTARPVPVDPSDAVANLRVIERIFEAAARLRPGWTGLDGVLWFNDARPPRTDDTPEDTTVHETTAASGTLDPADEPTGAPAQPVAATAARGDRRGRRRRRRRRDLGGRGQPGRFDGGAAAPPHFVEEAAAAGLTQSYSGDYPYVVGGGVAAFDCDDDGKPDLYLAGGEGTAGLYRNRSAVGGALRFERVPSPVTDLTAVTGAYPLDIDGDGLVDLAVLRIGENEILRGLGDCRFERANERFGIDGGDRLDHGLQRDLGRRCGPPHPRLRQLPGARRQRRADPRLRHERPRAPGGGWRDLRHADPAAPRATARCRCCSATGTGPADATCASRTIAITTAAARSSCGGSNPGSRPVCTPPPTAGPDLAALGDGHRQPGPDRRRLSGGIPHEPGRQQAPDARPGWLAGRPTWTSRSRWA